MKEGYYVVRTHKAGRIGEKTKFFVPGTRPTGKMRRKERDAIRKAAQNCYSAQKALARILNANFTEEDMLLGLDYSQEGYRKLMEHGRKHEMAVDSSEEEERRNAVWEAANAQITLCLRRVKNRLKKQGKELKAAYITSDMDGQTGELVRVHHHLVINAEAKDAFLDAWKKLGGVEFERLWKNQEDRTAVAEYLIRQVRRIPDAKKYRTTRNLIRPKPVDRIALSDAELRVPENGTLLYRQEYQRGQAQYIRYVLPEKGVAQKGEEKKKGKEGSPSGKKDG